MDRDVQVRTLLEDALSSGRSPDEVCAVYPELLEEVRRRWCRIQEIASDLEQAFPAFDSAPTRACGTGGQPGEPFTLPNIPGHQLEAVIGQGGMGVIYRAKHTKLDRIVAVKMLRSGGHASARELTGLVREAQAIAGLKHPHIVQVHDVGEFNGLPYFTMEFMEGGTLAQKLIGEPQPAKTSAEWTCVLAHAVHTAHERGIVHRDLKPANVLVGADGTLKITDFGLARHVAANGETSATTAARVGTPSYMPPEQALGTADAFKPAADIYSLGAILYEMLTGRPPFRGESPADTERQVLNDEPVPPSRLNPKTPRDLQTICLKCLQKQPERRYASAMELARDLDRFRQGEPIRARPVGAIEQAAKWARRRPAHAAFLVAVCVVIATGFAFGLWYQNMVSTRRAERGFRQSEARGAIRSALGQVATAMAAENWDDADRALAHARERTAEANSDELNGDIAGLGDAVRTARALEQVRQSRVLGAAEHKSVTDSYAAVFREVGITIDGDIREIAAALRVSPIRTQLIAGLDDWASVEYDLHASDRCEMILAIAREADPGSEWASRFRTPAMWSDREALLQLAVDITDRAGTVDEPAALQVGLVGLRLGEVGAADAGTEMLKRALVQRPTDFWMNWELGLAYLKAGRFQEAISPTRTAMALRPENAYACAFHAGVLSEAGDLEEGIPLLRRAVALAPDTRAIRRNLVYLLCKNGRYREAKAAYEWWNDRVLDAQGVNALRQFEPRLLDTRRYEEAIDVIVEIVRHDANDIEMLQDLGDCYYELERFEEAEAIFRSVIDQRPDEAFSRGRLYRILFKLGRIDEAIAAGQAAVERKHIITGLQYPLGNLLLSRGRLPEAAEAYELASRVSPSDGTSWIGTARTQLGLRDFARARSALDRAAALPLSVSERQQVARLEAIHLRIREIAARDPALLAVPSPAIDAEAMLDIAEWNWLCAGNPELASQQFESVFAIDPQLLSTAPPRTVFNAACAALAAVALRVSPHGDVTAEELARLKQTALGWLSSERDALIARRSGGDGPEQAAVAAEFRAWLTEAAIVAAWGDSSVSHPAADERWRTFWSDLKSDALRDNPGEFLSKARLSASLSNWAQASECYSELFRLQPDQSGEVWFERAAVQVLANDLAGYRTTCTSMLDSQGAASRIRAYHVARACTLSQPSDSDLVRAAEIGAREIRDSDAAWALTEKGALFCRASQSTEAIVHLKRSIDSDARVGMAVLNWLWLALANDKAGQLAESRRWFRKADAWLQRLDGERPPANGPSAIHVHNWLEANILHREAAALFVDSHGLAPTSPVR